MTELVLLLTAIVPQGAEPIARVDVIEVNSFYDGEGRLVFDQFIFWCWCPAGCVFYCDGWRMVKSNRTLLKTSGGWLLFENGRPFVFAPSKRRTWTQFDPEMLNRDAYATSRRRIK